MTWNRIVVCSDGHEYKMSELSVHSNHWNLKEVNKTRCPECHSATVWRYKYHSSEQTTKKEGDE